MKIKTFQNFGIACDTYLLTDGGEGALVDCSVKWEKIKPALEAEGARLKYILLTHGHFDHIAAVDEIRDATGAAVVVSREDADFLGDPEKNGSLFLLSSAVSAGPADAFVRDGDKLTVGDTTLTVMATPGHTAGSVCYLTDTCVFSGDTLFCRNIGRTDLYSGDEREIFESLEALCTLDPSLTVCPGHGESTTIGDEIRNNPYLN